MGFTTEKYWSQIRTSLCGALDIEMERHPAASEGHRLTFDVSHEEAERYNGDGGETLSIASRGFVVFVILMGLLWSVASANEIRVLLGWWFMLLYIEVSPKGLDPVVEIDQEIQVRSITRWHRFRTLLNLLLRSIIGVAVVPLGFFALIRVHTAEDLILNSLTMGFIITIDDMLFLGFTSEIHKRWVRS